MLKIPGKIPIEINPLFWLLGGFLGWINSGNVVGTLIWIMTIFVSVLAHEYGHALSAMYFGQKARIELTALGGVTTRQGNAIKTWQEVFVILAGPLMGALLVLISYQIGIHTNAQKMPYLAYWLKIMFVANIFWTAVNLLPINPLDGGRFLIVILEAWLGVRGVKIAFFISTAVAMLMTALFFIYQMFIGGILFFMWTVESYRSWKSSQNLHASDQNTELQSLLKEAEADIKRGDKNIAQAKLLHIRESAPGGVIAVLSAEYLAMLWCEEGRYAEAYELLLPFSKKLSVNSLNLLHQLAYRLKDWKAAINFGSQLYQLKPTYMLALVNAFCYANLGETKASLGWLQCAIKDGLPNLKETLEHSEFDKIRHTDQFQALRAR